MNMAPPDSNTSTMTHRAPSATVILVFLTLLIGSMFSVLMPPMKSFDEADHLRRAYMLTRGKILLMTQPCQEEGPLCHNGRSMSGGRIDAGLNEYLILRHEHSGHAQKENHEVQELARKIRWTGTRTFHEAPGTGYYFPLAYAPQAIGLAVGRMLDLTIEHSYYLARFSSLAFSVLALAVAFSLLNASPGVLALLVLPMSLFQAASASLDTFSTALAILATCCFIRAMRDGPVTTARTLHLLALSVLLVATSRAHLITMLLMPLAVAWRTGSRRSWLIAGLTVSATVIWMAIAIPSTVDFRVLRTVSPGTIAWHYLTNPADLLAVFARTLGAPGGFNALMHSFIGHSSGLRFSQDFHDLIGCLLAALAILSLASPTQWWRAPIPRALLLLMGAGSVFLGFLAMLLTFTPHPANTIQGVQGRYFLVPILLVLLSCSDWQGKPRWLERLRWGVAGLILCLSTLTSAGHIVDDFYTQHDPDAKRQMIVSAGLSHDGPITLRLVGLSNGSPGGTEINRVGIALATWQRQLSGKAQITFFDENGRSHSQSFDLGTVQDNKYHFFQVPPAHYVSGRITLLEGAGGLSVWEIRQDDDDSTTPSHALLSCAILMSTKDGSTKTPGCQ